MTKFTDGKQTISISMCVYENGNMSPDWEEDFFEVGSLPLEEKTETYIVDDVEYLIKQARDWERGEGDFSGELEESGDDPEDRRVYVTHIKYWYALLINDDDDDWSSGSHDREETIARARRCRERDYPDAYVAVIELGPNPVCVGEIRDFDVD